MQGRRLMDAEKATSSSGGSTRERKKALQQDVSTLSSHQLCVFFGTTNFFCMDFQDQRLFSGQ